MVSLNGWPWRRHEARHEVVGGAPQRQQRGPQQRVRHLQTAADGNQCRDQVAVRHHLEGRGAGGANENASEEELKQKLVMNIRATITMTLKHNHNHNDNNDKHNDNDDDHTNHN